MRPLFAAIVFALVVAPCLAHEFEVEHVKPIVDHPPIVVRSMQEGQTAFALRAAGIPEHIIATIFYTPDWRWNAGCIGEYEIVIFVECCDEVQIEQFEFVRAGTAPPMAGADCRDECPDEFYIEAFKACTGEVGHIYRHVHDYPVCIDPDSWQGDPPGDCYEVIPSTPFVCSCDAPCNCGG